MLSSTTPKCFYDSKIGLFWMHPCQTNLSLHCLVGVVTFNLGGTLSVKHQKKRNTWCEFCSFSAWFVVGNLYKFNSLAKIFCYFSCAKLTSFTPQYWRPFICDWQYYGQNLLLLKTRPITFFETLACFYTRLA